LTSPASWIAPAKQRQFLGQGGLAGVRVRNERKGAPAQNLVGQDAHKSTLAVVRIHAVAASGPLCVGTGAGYDARVASCQLLKSKSANR
jgi:hypothetical protein